MIPYWCLMDILKCLNRNDLERIQLTNRTLNDIVNQEFSTHPLRDMAGVTVCVLIENNEFVISIREYDHSCVYGRCFVPQARSYDFCGQDCDHFYPLNAMRPFLRENVRFRFTDISISDRNNFTPYTPDHISDLESIAHIWAGKHLYIYDLSKNDSSSLSLILESTSVLQCRTLHIEDNQKRIQVLQNPNIYSLYAIDLSLTCSFSDNKILQLVQQKESYPESNTMFGIDSDKEDVDDAMESIKLSFLASENCCRFRFIIKAFDAEDIVEFRLENSRTNEVLELKIINFPEGKRALIQTCWNEKDLGM
ncbi:hypothetical protein Ddc_16387 [Ditylenchus destructor]|nr:hypothetical protein Ddc_16387 [Ditylenchus destructor]